MFTNIFNRNNLFLDIVCGLVLSLYLVSWVPQSGAQSGLRPTSSQFSSDWVKVTMGGMMQVPDGNEMALSLGLNNKTDKTIWVRVTFNSPAPGKVCSATEKIDPGKTHMFTCPQKTLVANTDYPVEVLTFLDGPDSNQIESTHTKFYFSDRDVKGFNVLVKYLQKK